MEKMLSDRIKQLGYKRTVSKVGQSKMDIEAISRSWERIDTVDQMMGHTSDKVMLNTTGK